MGIIARLPCDEAAILAGSCGRPVTTNGPWILAATILGSSMVFIDGTVVNVALPALQSALHATLADVQWVMESYALFLATLLLIGGSLGDLYGRRKIFAAGVVLFSAASAWCGFAPNIRELIVARGLQGIGGALLVPGSLALISANFPEKERGRAIGTWSGFTAITAAIGPVLGGWFVEHGSWRWVFFINVPIGVAVLWLTLWKVPESRADNRSQRFDWLGGLLAVLAFGGIVLALIESMPAAGAMGFVSLIALLYWEARSSSPMVPLGLFRSRNFSGANLLTLFLYSALNGMLFFFPLDLIQVQGYSPTRSGSRSAASHSVDVLVVSLVWRTARSLRRQGSAGCGSADRGRRIRVVCKARYWRALLDHILPRGVGAGPRHGDQRCSAHDNCDERGETKLCGSGVRNQQRCIAGRRFARRRSFRSVSQWSFPERPGTTIGPSRPGAGGACTNRSPTVQAGGRRNGRRSRAAGYRGCIRRGLSRGVVDSGWAGARQFLERRSAHQRAAARASMTALRLTALSGVSAFADGVSAAATSEVSSTNVKLSCR